MSGARPAEPVLGSVQLGLAYAAANRADQPSPGAPLNLLQRAGSADFETVRAYRDSEDRLSGALHGQKTARSVTKLGPLAELSPSATREEVRATVDRSISQSMIALKRGRLDCLLLDCAAYMTAFECAVWERLIEMLEDGTVLSLGVSVQSPAEAMAALDNPDVQHLQLPFNLLDWRWRQSAVIDRVRARPHLTIHAGSVLLQGLLASTDPGIWPQIDGVDPADTVARIASLVREFRRESAADLCLAFVRGQDWIDGVVVGTEVADQLETNLHLFVRPPLTVPECEEIERRMPQLPEQLLDPALWP
jgi:aryl-alcohol dehydrogenase-like predicted oxidoreductase